MHMTHCHMVSSGQRELEGTWDNYSSVVAVYRLIRVEHFEQHSGFQREPSYNFAVAEKVVGLGGQLLDNGLKVGISHLFGNDVCRG